MLTLTNIEVKPEATRAGTQSWATLTYQGILTPEEQKAVAGLKPGDQKLSLARCAEHPDPLYGGAFYDVSGTLVYIKEIIFNGPAVIVFWSDDTKTSSVCDDRDTYNAELGATLAVMKKLVGSTFTHKLIADWVPAEKVARRTLADVRKDHKKN